MLLVLLLVQLLLLFLALQHQRQLPVSVVCMMVMAALRLPLLQLPGCVSLHQHHLHSCHEHSLFLCCPVVLQGHPQAAPFC